MKAHILAFCLFTAVIVGSSVTLAQDQFKAADIASKAQEFVKENPNCTNAVIDSLKKKSTMTCAEALKPNTKKNTNDKKKALQEKCESLKTELKSAQGSCVSK